MNELLEKPALLRCAIKIYNKEAFWEIDKAFEYFCKSDPCYDCSVETRQKPEMEHEEK